MWRLPLYEQPQQVDNTGAIADDGTLYLGVHNASILQGQIKTLLAIRDTVTSVPIGNASDLRYSLKQNYPNPFNSLTHIRYSIIKSSNVLLKVFDILGNEVATLVNVYQNLGEYDVLFEANDLSSGIYFYTLSSGNFTATKKLILLK